MGKFNPTIKHFYTEPIIVTFNQDPTFIKSPPCPDMFIWRDKEYLIKMCLSEKQDFSRRGKMARNMQPQHIKTAETKGSWGVGRFYFDIRTQNGQYFRIYYDRAPKNAIQHSGNWFLLAELSFKKK